MQNATQKLTSSDLGVARTFHVPGFTAEVALGLECNRFRGRQIADVGNGSVELAFWRCWGGICCDEFDYCITTHHLLM